MNWGQIKAAVREYSHRADISDALMATFLTLAEQRIHYGESNTPKLRCAAMRATATLASGTQPVDYLEAIKVHPVGSPDRPLIYAPLSALGRVRHAYSWNGQTLVLSDDATFPVELAYFKRLPALTTDNSTNWVTDNAPAIYITAIGVEVGDWSRDAEYGGAQAAKYTSACSSLMSNERAAAISGSPLITRSGK